MSLIKSWNRTIPLLTPHNMARQRKKTHTTSTSAPDIRLKSQATGLIVSILVALILGGIPFGLGKYIEFNSPGPFDSGSYVYSAKHLLDGARMGVDEMPSARPGTLIMNIIGVKLFGFNDVGPKIVQMFLQIAALVFMFITLRKLFGAVAGVIGVTLAAIYLSAPLIAKFGNVKEQFMIAFMIYTACSFLWYEFSKTRFWLIFCGFFALQPYYFKPTGMSVVFAIILYLLVSRIVSKNLKTLLTELAFFLCGYAVGLIVPGVLYTWQQIIPTLLKSFPPIAIVLGAGILALGAIFIYVPTISEKNNITALKKTPQWIWAVVFVGILIIAAISQWNTILSAAGLKGSRYLSDSLSAKGFSQLAPQVFRYYKALSAPILMALASIVAASIIWIRSVVKKTNTMDIQSKAVWAIVIWWFLDMVFIWISPRSYEQYYLPLCGSSAMLSGYIVWKWQKHLMLSQNKIPWLAGGLVSAIALGCLTIPIFIGQRYSPDRGKALDYIKVYGVRKRGFGPTLKELSFRKKNSWTEVGNYIRTHSTEKDGLYVWGWYPGIYVQAQRLSPVSKASESNMHVMPPGSLQRQVNSIVEVMKKNPPKFIVDSRKIHFPNDRPPLELWPHLLSQKTKYGQPIPNNPSFVTEYDTLYKQLLSEKFDPKDPKYNRLPGLTCWLGRVPPPWTQAMPDEAERYEAMKPFREFVMNNYQIVGHFGDHVLFQYKPRSNERTR